ncbi:MAG: hypothetical protein L0Y77_05495 [Chlorobi bacterium]|nr:hypothetical protein [Chlorobiota bacterium]
MTYRKSIKSYVEDCEVCLPVYCQVALLQAGCNPIAETLEVEDGVVSSFQAKKAE